MPVSELEKLIAKKEDYRDSWLQSGKKLIELMDDEKYLYLTQQENFLIEECNEKMLAEKGIEVLSEMGEE